MKELEKTKRISISAVLFLLVVLIAILTFRKPTYVFENNTATTLQKIIDKDYILTLDEFNSKDPSQYVLIDVRSNFEFAKGHIKDAINISTHQAFDDSTTEMLRDIKNGDKTIIVYGKNPDEADSAWMLLYQLGYENIKILCAQTNYINNKFEVKNYPLEKPAVNYAQVMKLAKNATANTKESKKVSTKPKPPKRIITKPKKKKRVPEGGC
jgi:rhodanese-related sulfurtransferase